MEESEILKEQRQHHERELRLSCLKVAENVCDGEKSVLRLACDMYRFVLYGEANIESGRNV